MNLLAVGVNVGPVIKVHFSEQLYLPSVFTSRLDNMCEGCQLKEHRYLVPELLW